MEIHYCAQCGARIAPEDITAGRAKSADGFNFRCERCGPAGAAAPQPGAATGAASRPSRRSSPAAGSRHVGAHPTSSNTRHRIEPSVATKPEKKRPISMALVGVGIVALCGLLALIVLAFSGSSGSTPNRPEAKSSSTSPPPPTPVPDVPKPTATTPPAQSTVNATANDEKLAQEAFDALTKFAGLAENDRAGRAVRVEQFLERHGKSMLAARARILLSDLKQPETGIRDHTIFVNLGVSIERTLTQAKAAHYVYGPKQEYDAATGETQIYLPYGINRDFYFGEIRLLLEDAKEGRLAELRTPDSDTAALLAYKLQFDKPIGEFRLRVEGVVELDLGPTCVAGVEYSTDGAQWRPVKEYTGAEITVYKVFGPFIENATITGLKTQTLYLRFYSRDSANPQATRGKSLWLKSWMSGDPGWGDAATTFFAKQPRIWVKEAR